MQDAKDLELIARVSLSNLYLTWFIEWEKVSSSILGVYETKQTYVPRDIGSSLSEIQ